MNLYEFFAGGGMARAGLGNGWACRFANDFDPKKAASYAANWGDAHLKIGDVAKIATDRIAGHCRSCLGVVPLSGFIARRRRRGP